MNMMTADPDPSPLAVPGKLGGIISNGDDPQRMKSTTFLFPRTPADQLCITDVW